ncbi:GNAT family N-acetyltransferase [Moorena sp. SIO4A5]|uniref:GNAT family N-acetyltransferase n=1 Tax=Moorena sp. SIO4A5 TaxID=2607838 RepID=UPI0013C9AE73|nr:GNAT family N-acetyltransferase [Moorena sp. SIO4A5]NEO24427.1 GNAT family N-acetyltransferase [Moorena sp. SIO4A5]
MIEHAQRLVDGEGSARVLMHLQDQKLRLRAVREDDCELLWQWVNEPQVRASAFSSTTIPWDDHVQWFRSKLADPSCYIFIAQNANQVDIGQIRFDCRYDGNAEVDLSLASDQRGLGYGSRLIEIGIKQLFQQTATIHCVHAYIKLDNLASMRAFERAGFQKLQVESIKGHPALHYRYSRDVKA